MLKKACPILIFILFLAFPNPSFASSLRDVVISETAWSGTIANQNHEWIELYNNTNEGIDITGWTLRAVDGTPNIVLFGVVNAKNYFLLERTGGYTTSIVEDQIYSGALNDSGESLELKRGDGILIDTANISGGAWREGTGGSGAPERASMERLNLQGEDTDDNWVTNDGVTRNGLDVNGNPINGTPKGQNSQGFILPTPTPTNTPTPTLTKAPTPTKAPTVTKSPTVTKTPSTSISADNSKESVTPTSINRRKNNSINIISTPNTRQEVAGVSDEKDVDNEKTTQEDEGTPAYLYSVTTGLGMIILACVILLYRKFKTKNEEEDF